MHDNASDAMKDSAELPAIDFQSPGRFTVHNPQPDSPQSSPRTPTAARLEPQLISGAEQLRAHTLALLQQAQRSLCLYTPDLEPWLYDHSSIQQACTRFLLAHPRNRLRILVADSRRSISEGHRLLTLVRRMPSAATIRKLHPDYPRDDAAYLVVDQRNLLTRLDSDPCKGHALHDAPAQVRLSQSRFDQAWDRSLFDVNLRSLLL